MSCENWRKNITVIELLEQKAHAFSFVQATCVMEKSNALAAVNGDLIASGPAAEFIQPNAEFVRFSTRQSLSFANSDIESIARHTPHNNQEYAQQWKMETNFSGLTGSSGVLPFHYTETLLKRQKIKDYSMTAFLDLFNHRTTSLFFRAACKYNFAIEYQRKRLTVSSHKKNDNVTQALMSLVGLGTKHLNNRLETSDESLLYYSGLLTSQVRTAASLQQMLQHHFGVPVEIQEFVGQWQPLISDVRTRLPGGNIAGQNNQLGRSVMLGKKGWFAQGKVNIILGPLDKSQVERFSPKSNVLKALNEMVNLYLGFEHDYGFIMRLKAKDIPQQVGLSSKNTTLGWTSWLQSGKRKYNDDDIIDIVVSPRRLT